MTQGRKACRTGARCEAADLAEAIYCVVHHSDKDARELANAVGVKHGYLIDAANPDRQDTQFQARLIGPVTRAAGNVAIVEFLSRDAGGVFVRVPHVTPEHNDILQAHLSAVREFGEQAGHLEKAMRADSDGGSAITASEAARFSLEVDQTIARLVEMKLIVAKAARR